MAYNACNAIILEIDPELSAAEAHGMATGLLCINEHAEIDVWISEIKANSPTTVENDESILVRLFNETQKLLINDEFEFDLFLPDDDQELSLQTEALKNWCRGFLYSMGSVNTTTSFSKDAIEILRDIAEFTKLDTEVAGEEDEEAFMEITEYLRSAVLLLKAELMHNSEAINP